MPVPANVVPLLCRILLADPSPSRCPVAVVLYGIRMTRAGRQIFRRTNSRWKEWPKPLQELFPTRKKKSR